MAKVLVCDICRKEINPYGTRYIFNYVNGKKAFLKKRDMFDNWIDLDICPNCIDRIKKEVRKENE